MVGAHLVAVVAQIVSAPTRSVLVSVMEAISINSEAGNSDSSRGRAGEGDTSRRPLQPSGARLACIVIQRSACRDGFYTLSTSFSQVASACFLLPLFHYATHLALSLPRRMRRILRSSQTESSGGSRGIG